ncbi:rhomboid family intramembrane serine protease [Rhodoblastus sp.]|uniref:rhomboid family intramembrane serine protease n=1 Tax=Rhodoblastus sp. TaxID=1962975 RepID=UPI0026120ABD|nr:rhomboid family intramembrane serine protease [Rhodoblastus sp.]
MDERGQNMRLPGREPIFNVPKVIVVLLAILAIIHVWRALISPEADVGIVATFGFTPARFGFLIDQKAVLDSLTQLSRQSELEAQVGQFFLTYAPPNWLWITPLSYAFLHGDKTHLIFNCIWLAAFGAPVARRFGAARFLLLGAIGAIAGALTYLVLHPTEFSPMIGASAAISAYMGAAARFVFPVNGFLRAGWESETRPLATFNEMVANRQTMAFIAIWFISNLLIGMGAQTFGFSQAPIAWEAHIGGFFAGLLLAPLFDQRRKS